MITRERFSHILQTHSTVASWAIWAEEGTTPKSNVGDMSVFDLTKNPDLLQQLNPNIVMVGLNFARAVEPVPFSNFHDKRPQAQDYKLRYAFRDTPFYGAYMTDIIKDFEEVISGNVMKYLRANPDFVLQHVKAFEAELEDLGCKDPLIIAFGNDSYKILKKFFSDRYRIQKLKHYSCYMSKEAYRGHVLEVLAS